jgi:hypothetical protein
VLLHSLAGLNTAEVNMFLDAATIMRGWSLVATKYAPLRGAMDVWTAWHGPAAAAFFKELTRRCLLGVDASGRLVVHDVLVVLGRGVVLSETPRLEGHWGSRLWEEGGKVVGRQQVGPCSGAFQGAHLMSHSLPGPEHRVRCDCDMGTVIVTVTW